MAKVKKKSIEEGGTVWTTTISTVLPKNSLSSVESHFLKTLTSDYGYGLQEAVVALNKDIIRHNSPFDELREACPHARNFSARMLKRGIFKEIAARDSSQRECAKEYVKVAILKQKQAQKKVDDLIKAKKKHFIPDSRKDEKITPLERQKLWSQGNHALRCAHENLTFRKNKLIQAESVLATTHISLCNGTKALFKERLKITDTNSPAYDAWQEKWTTARLGNVYFGGSSDETLGNSEAHIDWYCPTVEERKAKETAIELFQHQMTPADIKHAKSDMDGYFVLEITIPLYYREKLGIQQAKVSVPIDIPMYKDALLSHIELHKHPDKEHIKKNSMRSSVSIRLMRQVSGDYKVHITLSTDQQKPKVVTNQDNGVLGMDLNNQHLDVCETDKDGNLLKYHFIDLPLKGKSSEHRETMIAEATMRIVKEAKAKGKDLMVEDLDFSGKKYAMESGNLPGMNHMLSELPYAQIRYFLIVQCYREGVNLHFVNPAYTSKIGLIKYSHLFTSLDGHGAAAFVIARRGMGLKERLPMRHAFQGVADEVPEKERQGASAPQALESTSVKRNYSPCGIIVPPYGMFTKKDAMQLKRYFKELDDLGILERLRKKENVRKQSCVMHEERMIAPLEASLYPVSV